MTTKIFIAVGSTASESISQLVSRLKECGIYKNTTDFRDQFIAIDTDSEAIDKFRNSGKSDNINGIWIPRTNREGNHSTPAKNAATYITPFNSSWHSSEVAVAQDGVFGYRRKSYADLSWVSELRRYIAKTYKAANEDDGKDYELIFVATSYGGSSSGLLMNVAEIARSCVKPTTPSFCLLMMPCESLKGSTYQEGWKNFLNFWQQFQQSVWERKLNSKNYAFPFFAGYMDEISGKNSNCMDCNLFKIKEDIENYTPSKTGCKQPFNIVFPLIPNSEKYDSGFHPQAVAELAIFLFYARAIKAMSDNGNIYSTQNDLIHEDERNFAGLRLVGARSSSYGTFYQQAVSVFKAECERFFGDIEKIQPAEINPETFLDQFEIKNIKAEFENIKRMFEEKLMTQITSSAVNEKIIGEEYLNLIRKNVSPFPSFDTFVEKYANYADSNASSAWWIATYQKYYNNTKNASERYENNKNKLKAIFNNINDLIEKYAQSTLSKMLKAEEKLAASIVEDAKKLLISTFKEFHRSTIAKAALELYPTNINDQHKEKETFSDKVNVWVSKGNKTFEKLLTWNGLKSQLNIPCSLDEDKQRSTMFVHNIPGDITSVCNDYDLHKRNSAVCAVHKVLSRFMLNATFSKENNQLNKLKGLQTEFDTAMDILIKDLQGYVSDQRVQGAEAQFSIKVGLRDDQQTFWPKETAFQGYSPILAYFAKDGISENGINFEMIPVKIRTDLLNNYGINSFADALQDIGITDERNADYTINSNGDEWIACNTEDSEDKITVKRNSFSVIEFDPQGDTPKDMFGVWVGEGKICMSPKEVITSYLGINTLIPTSETNLKTLQSRLLFTLHEHVFFGIFIGIVKNKLKAAMEEFKNKNDQDVTNIQKVRLTIKSPDGSQKYSTKEEGITLDGFGYDLDKKILQAVPIDMMKELSSWFKRQDIGGKGGTSAFALAMDKKHGGNTVKELEEYIERRELNLFQSSMSYGIPREKEEAINDLYEKCNELVSFEILQ